MAHAVALAQQGTLGLVCDPLGGLVELPCVFRNATGSAIALAAVEMALAGIEFAIPADEVIVSGLLYKGVLYRHEASTAAGPYPYTDEMRYGVWSVTKSAGNAIALFRLAQKYGPGILNERIVDYLPEAASYPGWQDVTFFDMANMASGHGFGSLVSGPNNMFLGYLDGDYAAWYEAPSEAEKVVFSLDQPVFPA